MIAKGGYRFADSRAGRWARACLKAFISARVRDRYFRAASRGMVVVIGGEGWVEFVVGWRLVLGGVKVSRVSFAFVVVDGSSVDGCGAVVGFEGRAVSFLLFSMVRFVRLVFLRRPLMPEGGGCCFGGRGGSMTGEKRYFIQSFTSKKSTGYFLPVCLSSKQ